MDLIKTINFMKYTSIIVHNNTHLRIINFIFRLQLIKITFLVTLIKYKQLLLYENSYRVNFEYRFKLINITQFY